jgi:acyl-CoA reductase-like NAD-dependent aldehyde dehydrogenase
MIYYSQNAGQNCIGIERLIVHSSQYEELYALLVERSKKLRLGAVLAPSPGDGFVHTVDCGSMIDSTRFNDLERNIRLAQQQGAQVEGGHRYVHPYHEDGCYFGPAVVGDAKSDSEIAQNERKCLCTLSRFCVVNHCANQNLRLLLC